MLEYPETPERIFTVEAVTLKYGRGALAEVGLEARALGMDRVALFTDRHLAETELVATVQEALKQAGLDVVLYDQVRVEPTDQSFQDAAAFARDGDFDGYISLGGGSVIDTCKAANLYATHPDDFLAYVNAPIGRARPVPGPLAPHIACPTTCGTGSEMTAAAIFDLTSSQVKTGISHRFLKPSRALVDPATTDTLAPGVIAATGLDVLTHAIESWTARPFTSRPYPENPAQRPPYQGANPWSDIGSLKAIELGGTHLPRAWADPDDTAARDALMFAATLAGMAFGNAGVHIPHAMSYAVAGLNHGYVARGYADEPPMVPHGLSVVVNAPAAFRVTARADPARHLEAARALGADTSNLPATAEAASEALAGRLIDIMRRIDCPNGLSALGYGEADIEALTGRAFQQQRLLAQAPLTVDAELLADIFRDAMTYW
ncbi:hydroxyacid-oxoacid transhydrogenase [Roseospirillum parvum]|uniref:hydroxyacid-oxoacid transhydrogenase n=1 Tax=Roseospirillum parvum TaxID=83401 RepID=A0A1G7V1S5_9PROT|nr:hydroxyacid-oxoacid transhydrogenase [Roseospirillum parvum]SDG53706.1 Alcohol dehydrogenase, class IV [Roseospirillum parvum]